MNKRSNQSATRRACTLEDVGTTPRDKQNTQTGGVNQSQYAQDVGKFLDIVNNIAQQNGPHVTSAKREDTFRKCVRLGK